MHLAKSCKKRKIQWKKSSPVATVKCYFDSSVKGVWSTEENEWTKPIKTDSYLSSKNPIQINDNDLVT